MTDLSGWEITRNPLLGDDSFSFQVQIPMKDDNSQLKNLQREKSIFGLFSRFLSGIEYNATQPDKFYVLPGL